ncbi:MAG TPA: glycosyl hydrolase 53 family protein [Tepidisphaeraceae bacterium]|jgi:arabinogalactan endo-1,4-beta-galactosidase|nr:glycosyl hydrolase 53 family protein [Tepidisphaeraceae bacterium]
MTTIHARTPIRLLRIFAGIFLVTCTVSTSAFTQTTTQPSRFLLGADISALAQVEQRGAVFRDNGKPGDAIAIFSRHGWNCFRLRLFVNPNGRGGTVNSLDYTRALAKRIKASGATFVLDLHYSDTWADPQHQVKPAAWKDLDFDSLQNAVEKYTARVMADLKANDALPQIVQIGNEITGGTLWPDAQVKVPLSMVKVYDSTVKPIEPPQPYDDAKQWDRFTRILAAGIRGVRQSTTSADHVRIMIHIDCGGDWPVTRWFFDHLDQHHIDYDIIGQSYYPYWHGTLANVRDNLQQTANRFHKDIIIVETAYPWKDAARWSARKNMAWPITAAGQQQFMEDLIRTVRETPDGHGIGVIYWHPEPPAGARWNGGDMALFDSNGNALPAMDALEKRGRS